MPSHKLPTDVHTLYPGGVSPNAALFSCRGQQADQLGASGRDLNMSEGALCVSVSRLG